MILNIQGKRYDFTIVSDYKKPFSCFFIKAQCKSTKRFSCINNLNAVLSEFHIEANDSKFADSIWVVTKNEAHKLVETAKEFLSDPDFLDYLEAKLDEDRELGEWENRVPC